jgi:DNA-directed RNA polymerase specialized sigma24 family protein
MRKHALKLPDARACLGSEAAVSLVRVRLHDEHLAEREENDRVERGSFADTCWSLVVRANGDETEVAREALNNLCRTYWYPLYCYVRRRGFAPVDAEDLVQGFFGTVLRRRLFARVDRDKGKMRVFLLATLKAHLADECRRSGAAKRGGGVEFVPIDTKEAEERYSHEPLDITSPDKLYDRRWALIFLQRVTKRLEEEWNERGKAEIFGSLNPYLFSRMDAEQSVALSVKLGVSEDNVRQSLHRLRESYKMHFRRELEEIVLTAFDRDEEMASLRAALM